MGFLHLGTASRLFLALLFAATIGALVVTQPSSAFAFASTTLKTPSGAGVSVNADSMFRDSEKQIVQLQGHVQIFYDQEYISCDRAMIDMKNQEVHAEGNLVISSAQAYVEGDGAIMSYKDNTGVITNGFVKSGQVIVEGALVRKVGPTSYVADDARFTACTTCPTAWTFSGKEIKADIGSYAYIKQSWFEVANFPVLWLPYLVVPLKSERQTGLLVPQFDYTGSGGTSVAFPYFWAISKSQDAQFTLQDYQLRGQKGLFNYRYMLSPTSFGELNTAFIRDQVFTGDSSFQGQPIGSHENRWFLTYNHSYDLPDGFVQKANINFMSDLRYNRDFPLEIGGQGDPALENRVSLTRSTEKTHASIDVDYYLNQLETNPVASNDDAVHRWPELRYSLAQRRVMQDGILSNLLFSFDADYVNFARKGLGWDDVTYQNGTPTIDRSRNNLGSSTPVPGSAPGLFDPGTDIIRTGQRLDLMPELSYPFRLGDIFEVLPVAQFRHTQYQFNIDQGDVNPADNTSFNSSPYRQYIRGLLSVRTRVYRVFGSQDSQPVAAQPPSPSDWVDNESQSSFEKSLQLPQPLGHPSLYRHEMQPEIAFSTVPYLNQPTSPFFGSASDLPVFLNDQPVGNSDFFSKSGRGVQFDYQDRLINRNTMSFILGNTLVRKSWAGEDATYKQIASLKLAQSYDFDEASRTQPPKYPWSDTSALLDVHLKNFETNTSAKNF
jgi:LPS-assembly protein